ncbi:DNA phosphorothioation-dependent restriction protein DptF [Staphylococcus felis]|nr:DNA phosphorothioation-dependent restriction protein DptF [Staphylococcus felis]
MIGNEKNFYDLNEILETLELKDKFTDCYSIDVKAMNKAIYKFKLMKKINNIEFSILCNIKDVLQLIQEYDRENDFYKLDEYINHYKSYKGRETKVKTDKFQNIIKYLSASSKESIVNSEIFDDFNEYLHVERPIQYELENALEDLRVRDKGIIFLVGSVGDGKSHLLSYFNKKKPHLLENVKIHNDATESNNPYKTAAETLIELFENYQNNIINKLVVAINIGMLHNLKKFLEERNIENNIIETIERSNIFSTYGMDKDTYEYREITLVSFLNEEKYKISNGEINNNFIKDIFYKVFNAESSNPFYQSFIQDDGYSRREPIYLNYQLLLNKDVQKTIMFLLNKIQIENKRIISTRALLNFIHDIIVPEGIVKENNAILVNLLFDNIDRSQILTSMSKHDPILIQNSKIDELNIELYNTLNLKQKSLDLFGKENFEKISDYLLLLEGLEHSRKFKILLRLDYLFNYHKYEPETFNKYIYTLENIQSNNMIKRDFLNKIQMTMYSWNGSPKKEFIYSENIQPNTTLRIGLKFNPRPLNIIVTKKLTIIVIFEIENNKYELEVDYNLFKLMSKVEEGYLLKTSDIQESVVFSEFMVHIVNDLESTKENLINMPLTGKTYLIREGFIGYEIERV